MVGFALLNSQESVSGHVIVIKFDKQEFILFILFYVIINSSQATAQVSDKINNAFFHEIYLTPSFLGGSLIFFFCKRII